jgi:hypothetical protein
MDEGPRLIYTRAYRQHKQQLTLADQRRVMLAENQLLEDYEVNRPFRPGLRVRG